MDYGAALERGEIIQKTPEGRVIIKSDDRDGILTLPMKAPEEAKTGDRVLFCEFADGEGAVLTILG